MMKMVIVIMMTMIMIIVIMMTMIMIIVIMMTMIMIIVIMITIMTMMMVTMIVITMIMIIITIQNIHFNADALLLCVLSMIAIIVIFWLKQWPENYNKNENNDIYIFI